MGRPTKKPKLTPKQKKFVNEYLIDLNAAAAARRAGYSKNAARVIGPENLSKPAVMEYLKQRRKSLDPLITKECWKNTQNSLFSD
jgi:phage terminase small subunit